MAKIPGNRPAGATLVSWNEGPLAVGDNMPSAGANFGTGAQTVHAEMDQVGDSASLEQHTDGRGNAVDFNRGDFFLQTDRPRDRLILTFSPPVNAAAFQVAAIGIVPAKYRAFVQARFIDGTASAERTKLGTTVMAKDGRAAMIGLQREAGDPPIESIAIRVEPQSTVDFIRRFGVNQVSAVAAGAAGPLRRGATAAARKRPAKAASVKKAGGGK